MQTKHFIAVIARIEKYLGSGVAYSIHVNIGTLAFVGAWKYLTPFDELSTEPVITIQGEHGGVFYIPVSYITNISVF